MGDSDRRHRLEIRDLSKSFGAVKVLDSVSLDLEPGRVHALLGHNGSGKSTLIRILAGVYGYESGHITHGDEVLQQRSPKSSAAIGIRFVHQRKNVVDQMSGADNAGLGGTYETRARLIDWKGQRRRAMALVNRVRQSTEFDPRVAMSQGSEILKTYMAIGRALDQVTQTGILVLDEPTASLSPTETDELLETIRTLRDQGTSILYVTHRLREVTAIADEITVLRDGRVTLQGAAADIDHSMLVTALSAPGTASTPSLEVDQSTRALGHVDISVTDHGGLAVTGLQTGLLAGIDFRVGPGEVVGFAGADGSGREDIARAIGGGLKGATVRAVRTRHGRTAHLDPLSVRGLGIALALESRSRGAVFDAMSITENLTLRSRKGERPLRGADAERFALEWIMRLGVLPSLPETPLAVMSGGNRQKVVIAAALALEPDVLVVDDPTAGVDVNAATQLRRLLVDFARESNAAVVWVSSDLGEMEAVCDRVICVRDGVAVSELQGERLTEFNILTEIS